MTSDSSHGADSRRIRSPITGAAILLGVCVAMYLAVGGMVFILTSPAVAAAMVPLG